MLERCKFVLLYVEISEITKPSVQAAVRKHTLAQLINQAKILIATNFLHKTNCEREDWRSAKRVF
jgi:hypothetical protein